MSILLQNSAICTHQSSADLLNRIDLAEWEAQYHWASFEQHLIDGQCHLEKYDERQAHLRQLKAQLTAALVAQEEPAS